MWGQCRVVVSSICLSIKYSRSDSGFLENQKRMAALVEELRTKIGTITQGGGSKAVERHTSRGKLVARDRINLLLDPGAVPAGWVQPV